MSGGKKANIGAYWSYGQFNIPNVFLFLTVFNMMMMEDSEFHWHLMGVYIMGFPMGIYMEILVNGSGKSQIDRWRFIAGRIKYKWM